MVLFAETGLLVGFFLPGDLVRTDPLAASAGVPPPIVGVVVVVSLLPLLIEIVRGRLRGRRPGRESADS